MSEDRDHPQFLPDHADFFNELFADNESDEEFDGFSDINDEYLPNETLNFDPNDWSIGDFEPFPLPFTGLPGLNVQLAETPTVLDFFELYFKDNYFEEIANQTNLYAFQYLSRNENNLHANSRFRKWRNTTAPEIKVFLGMILAMGLVTQLDIKEYWSTDPVTSTPFFPSCMPRDRFQLLMSFFHLNDNEHLIPRGQEGYNPLYKLGSIYSHIVNRFSTTYTPNRQLSFDEGMIPWRGNLSFRVYNPDKPIKYGIKVYMLCDAANGYITKYKLYTGKQEGATSVAGATYDLIMDMMRGYYGQGYTIYCDNYYASPILFWDLWQLGVGATGTVRQTRIGVPQTLKDKKLDNRGQTAAMKNGPLCIIKYKDSKDVYVLSTVYKVNDIPTGKQDQRTGNPVNRPHMVVQYDRTAVVYDERMGSHYHMWNDDFTEKPERFTEPIKRCKDYGLLKRCQNLESRMATEEEMKILHSEELIKLLKRSTTMTDEEMKETSRKFDFLYFHKDVYQNARLSLGCTLDLVEHIIKGKAKNGMAIVRPPGHHAMENEFCGYCFLNNVAVSAKLAVDHYGLKRVLILDWDVHHGQGTQYFFYDDPRVMYFSIHTYLHGKEWPYLRESDYDHIGKGSGVGYNINVPLNAEGCGDSEYLAVFFQLLLPIAYEFDPELILVSAGYDCAIGCPEGEMEVTPACFAHFVNLLSPLAGGKVCLIMEGGYCIKSLSEGVALSLRALLGDPCPRLEPLLPPCHSIVESILNAIKALRPYWKCLQFQGNLQNDEIPEISSLLDWPPITDVEFYTEHTRPRRYSLSQDCYDKEYELVADHLDTQIDSIIAKTSLKKAPNKVCIVYDEKMLQHRDISSGGFEECPERIQHIYNALVKNGLWEKCHKVKGRPAKDEELSLAHSPNYIRQIKKIVTMDDDAIIVYQKTFDSIYLCRDSFESAAYAVGSLLSVVDSILLEEAQHGVALIRPPGHHAEAIRMMGFCLFNNIGIAAKYAQNKFGVQRILILDWDVHHGNAIQRLFYNDPSVLYISLHRFDKGSFFPFGGEGHHNRCGTKNGTGHNINIAWNDGPKCDADYIAAFQEIVLPVCYEYSPELVFVAAGFDAGVGDHMGNYNLTSAVYSHMTQMLLGLANGRVILSLEGGYNIEGTTNCMVSCVSVLLGDTCPNIGSCIPSDSAVECICSALDVQKQYWKSLQYRVSLPTIEQLQKIKEKKETEEKTRNHNHVNRATQQSHK